MTVEEKGLPFFKKSYQFGNLFILFTVKFPDQFNKDQVSQIQNVLSGQAQKQKTDVDMDAETCVLKPFAEG